MSANLVEREGSLKEVLIMNLTRMGDLVQTTPVIAGIRERHPGVRITLFVNSVFADVCRYVAGADRLVVFDVTALKKMLRDPACSVVACYRRLESVLAEVNTVEYDLALNFTHSNESALLASLLRAKDVRGITAGTEGNRVIRHPWQRYFFQVVASRNLNPFHLCDIYTKVGEAGPRVKSLRLDVPPDAAMRAEMLLRGAGARDGDTLVGFQLGASHNLKRWPASSFAKAADLLNGSAGARAVLIGTQGETELGREFESFSRTRPVNLIGKTGLGELLGVLRKCRVLVSNDTGPLHLATAVGTPVVDISLGHVCFRETGPYGEGHIVVEAEIQCAPCGFHVECKDPVCKGMVPPEAVADLAGRLLRDDRLDVLGNVSPWKNVQVYRSQFAEDGMVEYRPLVRRPPRPETVWSYLYRRTWPWILDGAPPPSAGEESSRLAAMIRDRHGEVGLRAAVRIMAEGIEPVRGMLRLANEIRSRVSSMAMEAAKREVDTGSVELAWKGVPGLERGIEDIGRANRFLWPLVEHLRMGKEALEGTTLDVLSEETVMLYAGLSDHLSGLEEILEHMAGNSRECHAHAGAFEEAIAIQSRRS